MCEPLRPLQLATCDPTVEQLVTSDHSIDHRISNLPGSNEQFVGVLNEKRDSSNLLESLC